MKRIVIGAGLDKIPGFLHTDYPIANLIDHSRMGAIFPDKSVKVVLAEHVFEHFTISEAILALQA